MARMVRVEFNGPARHQYSPAPEYALRAGDVVRFDDPADGPVAITIDGCARAWAVPGRVGDRIALRLTSGVEALEA